MGVSEEPRSTKVGTAAFASFWGKARAHEGAEVRWHPLWKHSLDVAAVGCLLAQQHSLAMPRVAEKLGWEPDDFCRLWSFLLALHDLGKFSRLFQAKAPEFWPDEVLGPLDASLPRDPGHSQSGLTLLLDCRRISPALDRWFPDWPAGLRGQLLETVLGHHGRPLDEPPPLQVVAGQAEQNAAASYAEALEDLLTPPALPPPKARLLRKASWALAGQAVVADWVGSNQRWFPYCADKHDLRSYWHERALPRAERALDEAGLARSLPGKTVGLSVFLPASARPSPVQAWAEKVDLPPGPVLALIEDMTGGGKTEAALVLAQRLMAADRARGIYFALPTMATANAMYNRLAASYRRLFAEDAHPSLVLAHGRASLHERFRDSILPLDPPERPAGYHADEQGDSAAESTAWLASERRKALLADVGVGTVDQALLSVLPAKHQALRLLGLAEKVLIIDEAHAYDAYMGRELDRLLAFQAAQGGHAIVLSATLPQEQRRRFATVWARESGAGPVELSRQDYPLVTLVSGSKPPVEEAQQVRSGLARRLTFSRSEGLEEVVSQIAAAASEGAAVAWVRNTVDEAIEAQARLREAGVDAMLFHARYTMGDRLEIENRVLQQFGREAAPESRRGGVLVATQVVEQSLDLDFDFMVSDLAPVDLVLQRAGRLWRHLDLRPVSTRPLATPQMLLYAPDPSARIDREWIKRQSGGTSAVYGDDLLLWRSAHALLSQRNLAVPEDLRKIIEWVYRHGVDEGDPAALHRSHDDALGKQAAERSFAEQNLLKVASGYTRNEQPWQDETAIATRLGDEGRILRLARWQEGRLSPWHDHEDPMRAWMLSEVSVRGDRVSGVAPNDDVPQAMMQALRETWGRYEADRLLVPLQQGEQGAWYARLLDARSNEHEICYDDTSGLQWVQDT